MIPPTSSTAYFILLTTVYFSIKYLMVDQWGKTKNKGWGIAITIMYLATMLLIGGWWDPHLTGIINLYEK